MGGQIRINVPISPWPDTDARNHRTCSY
jgi:hypothetical protein